MNFIAGFFFMLFDQREEYAFTVLKEVISRFHMHDLFDSQLPMLKLNFYQLDRLISLLLPDLHSHFKDEAINSSYFSAPYFITIFTSTL
jgi:ecotropic viral integration site 5 protein